LQPTRFGPLSRVYDRVPYFAYHKQDEQIIVGFYFLSDKGYTSAAYELIDEQTKQAFGDHFVRIMSEAASSTLVEFDGARGRPRFDEALFRELYERMCVPEQLGKDKTDELVLKQPGSEASNTPLQSTNRRAAAALGEKVTSRRSRLNGRSVGRTLEEGGARVRSA